MLWLSLHRPVAPLSFLLYLLLPRCFVADLATIRAVAHARTQAEFEHLLNRYHRLSMPQMHSSWKMRVSGARLAKLASATFQPETSARQ